MTTEQPIYSNDLAGVIVGETAISDVHGEHGLLSYRGIDINDLVGVPYLHVVWMVLFGDWPNEQEKSRLKAFMCKHSRLTHAEIDLLQQVSRDLHPMLMLQGLVPLLKLPEEQLWERRGRGTRPVPGSEDQRPGCRPPPAGPEQGRTAADSGQAFPRKLPDHVSRRKPRPRSSVACWTRPRSCRWSTASTAGTFAGRVCAGTLAPIQSCISASIGTLFGKLHGGADQAALEMAMDIGSPEQGRGLRQGLPGQQGQDHGHGPPRIPHGRSPRQDSQADGDGACARTRRASNLLDTLVAVEEACQREFADKGKEIWANVEFYKGAVFHSLGIPTHYFTAMFAMARVYGYIAHFLEFRQNSCLIRPRAQYTGPAVGERSKSAA